MLVSDKMTRLDTLRRPKWATERELRSIRMLRPPFTIATRFPAPWNANAAFPARVTKGMCAVPSSPNDAGLENYNRINEFTRACSVVLLALSRAASDTCSKDFSATNGSMGPPFWSHKDCTDIYPI